MEPRTVLNEDEAWMQRALFQARLAETNGEVPIGAVLVRDGKVLAEAFNCPISTHDPTAHAEIVALRQAGKRVRNYRLVGTTLYVTLEPCVMCMGAILHARIARLVFGATDPQRGATVSALPLIDADFPNHRVELTQGILASECARVLREFFRARRSSASSGGTENP
jgi:tRNA(adenine34) deaminase